MADGYLYLDSILRCIRICIKKCDIYYGNGWRLIVIFHYDVYQSFHV